MIKELQAFGEQLVCSQDLDPVYSCLKGANLDEPQLCRWLTAYLMFYHVGSASYLSDAPSELFWDNCAMAAANIKSAPPGGGWPRSTERRHFRGAKASNAVERMRVLYPAPESAWRSLKSFNNEIDVINYIKVTWPMHGPWAGFKAADISERVAGYPIRFSRNTGMMYESPHESLINISYAVKGRISDIYVLLLQWVAGYAAPPGLDRACGPQELETILCKWGSMQSGHYYPGKDIAEVREALGIWTPYSKTAARLLAAAPPLLVAAPALLPREAAQTIDHKSANQLD
jgi:hypothetical protein